MGGGGERIMRGPHPWRPVKIKDKRKKGRGEGVHHPFLGSNLTFSKCKMIASKCVHCQGLGTDH